MKLTEYRARTLAAGKYTSVSLTDGVSGYFGSRHREVP